MTNKPIAILDYLNGICVLNSQDFCYESFLLREKNIKGLVPKDFKQKF